MNQSLTNRFFSWRFGLAAAAAIITATSSFAGSMDKSVAPAPVPECDWSGFYAGLHVGLANLQAKFTDLDYYEGYDTRVFEDTNFTGGGQLGYNWQFGAAVIGIEADGAYLNTDIHRRTIFADINETNPDYQDDIAKVDLMGTLRARAGLAFQNALIYVTGGVAYAHGEWTEAYVNNLNGPPNETDTYWYGDDWRWGWTGGAGIEYMLGCNWTLRAEGLYTNLLEDTVPGTSDYTPYEAYRYEFDDELWTVRVGLNYRFGNLFRR